MEIDTLKKPKRFFSRKALFATLFLGLVGLCSTLSGCTKQKNCDCGLKGKFVYYEEPKKIMYCGGNQDANAVLIAMGITEYGITDCPLYIVSSVPTSFMSKDTLNVAVCLNAEKRDGCRDGGASGVFKLKCIEKED